MNRDQLLFGVAYYREYMPYERLDQDIEMMKKAITAKLGEDIEFKDYTH